MNLFESEHAILKSPPQINPNLKDSVDTLNCGGFGPLAYAVEVSGS